jgi:hypothetical protein
MVKRMDREMTNSETIMTKEARSPNKQRGRLVGYWVIWKFVSHSDLGISHSAERHGLAIRGGGGIFTSNGALP